MTTSALPEMTLHTSPAASTWSPSPPDFASASGTAMAARYDFSYRRTHSHLDIASPPFDPIPGEHDSVWCRRSGQARRRPHTELAATHVLTELN